MLILNLTLSCFHVIVSSFVPSMCNDLLVLDTTDNGTRFVIYVVELLKKI